MCGQVRRVQTCSDYQVKGDKKRGACRSQGRSSSTVQWDDVENKVCTYRNRFLSKNSLWIIMSWARKGLSLSKHRDSDNVPRWISLIGRVTFHSGKDKSSSVSPVPNPVVLFLPAWLTATLPALTNWKLTPELSVAFGLTSCYILTSSC